MPSLLLGEGNNNILLFINTLKKKLYNFNYICFIKFNFFTLKRNFDVKITFYLNNNNYFIRLAARCKRIISCEIYILLCLLTGFVII